MAESDEPAGFEAEGAARSERGHGVIAGYVKHLGNGPGVYRMLDDAGAVLYVGKARSLKKRVSSYAKPTGHSARIGRMIAATASMMFLSTETETEALLLEQNLIKQLKPRYNVLLRDDKSFPNILIPSDHAYPPIKKHRGMRRQKGTYFGPFASAGAVNRTLNQLQKAFLLRNCADSMFEGRTRPCLQYQIKRCSAPCVGKISEADYAADLEDATRFLQGRTSTVQKKLAEDMQEASAAMEFERAAALRDCVEVFFIRAHQNWGNRAYFPRLSAGTEPGEVLEAFIAQFYDNKQPPKQLLLSHVVDNTDLIEEALSLRAERKVQLILPQRGEKAQLVESAMRNAREALARKMSESASQNRLLDGLASAFELDAPPERIEVYDNSHIQGTNAVGGMIVAGREGFLKSSYRKFNIRSTDLTPGDDFGMMKEVLTRRFARLLKEDPDRESGTWPDLLLIDGGAGQISAVAQVMAEMGVDDIALIGVAKGVDRDAGKEEFYRPGARPMALPHRDPVLYFIQRLRDEAHRFAIGAHRAKRAKAVSATPLDDIPGVGATRKRALLSRFGSAKAVSRAGLADLKATDGISDALAEAIYGHFNSDG